MVDNFKIQFAWPKANRTFCENNKCSNKSWHPISKTYYLKYLIIHPITSEKLQLVVNESTSNCYIQGSLRRWHYGKLAASRDLNKSALIKVMNIISEITEIPQGTILYGEINRVELGMNTKLKREHELFIPSLMRYGSLRRKQFGLETVGFLGTKKSIICYDKSKEVCKRYLKKKQSDRILAKHLILRTEIKIHAKSGVSYGNKLQNLKEIIINWDFLLDSLNTTFIDDVEKIDLFSTDLDLTGTKLSYSQQLRCLAYVGMKTIGMNNVLTFINNTSAHRSKNSEHRSKIFEIYHTYKSNSKQNLINEIYDSLRDRSDYLKN